MKNVFSILLLGFLLASCTATAQTGTISTVAGYTPGVAGYSGDGAAATLAKLNYPESVVFRATDSAMFIADANNNVIRKVTLAGVISTFAGTGTAGYSGDGFKATKAKLHAPYGLACDAVGRIYFADVANNVIRKIDTNNLISTVAGNGTYGYSGDTYLATAANLANPSGITLDSLKNIYISDTRNHAIRKVTVSTGVITTIGGTGVKGYTGDAGAATSATFNFPRGLLWYHGYILIADQMNNVIREIAATGTVTTWAGTGTLGYKDSTTANATFDHPTGLAQKLGAIYIADQGNQVIRVVTTGTVTTYAGTGTGKGTNAGGYSGDGAAATLAKLNLPSGIWFSPVGDAYIADDKNNVIRKVLH